LITFSGFRGGIMAGIVNSTGRWRPFSSRDRRLLVKALTAAPSQSHGGRSAGIGVTVNCLLRKIGKANVDNTEGYWLVFCSVFPFFWFCYLLGKKGWEHPKRRS
jgi:hypothetical protein